MIELTTPISDDDLSNLNVGDQITISGTIYTGRDAALPQFVDLIKRGNVPFDTNGMVIMHTAFSKAGIAPTRAATGDDGQRRPGLQFPQQCRRVPAHADQTRVSRP